MACGCHDQGDGNKNWQQPQQVFDRYRHSIFHSVCKRSLRS
jgi:hypothetical protein